MQENLNGFFLGCSSPDGFTSFYDELYYPHEGGYAYIIKGGPGTGKSTLMKKIYSLLVERNVKAECIFCSSDPDSLDALIIPQLNCCIADGTPPHTAEPKYYGVCEEFVNLGDFLDKESLLKNKSEIISLTDLNKAQHKLCRENLYSSSLISNEIEKVVSSVILKDKVKNYALSLCQKEIPFLKDSKGKEYHRFISAPTSKGIILKIDRANDLCDRFYIIEDEYYTFTKYFLSLIKDFALKKGYDIIESPSATSKDSLPIHLLIPQLKLGFILSNRLHEIKMNNSQIISAWDFYDKKELNSKKDELELMIKSHDRFIEKALVHLKTAKEIHDKLESQYIKSMDFSLCDNLSTDIVRKMFK